MKREDLKAFDLSDDIIDKIMGLHGRGIEAEKVKSAKANEELKLKLAEIEQINAKLADLQTANADNEKIKAELSALKAEISENEKKAKEKAELDKLYAELDGYVPENMAYMNDYAKNGVRAEAVKLFKENPTIGLKSCFERLIKDDKGNYRDGIFANPVKAATLPKMGNVVITNETMYADNLAVAMGINNYKD